MQLAAAELEVAVSELQACPEAAVVPIEVVVAVIAVVVTEAVVSACPS